MVEFNCDFASSDTSMRLLFHYFKYINMIIYFSLTDNSHLAHKKRAGKPAQFFI